MTKKYSPAVQAAWDAFVAEVGQERADQWRRSELGLEDFSGRARQLAEDFLDEREVEAMAEVA